MFLRNALQDTQSAVLNCISGAGSPEFTAVLKTSNQYLTKALALVSSVPRASAGITGPVGLGDTVAELVGSWGSEVGSSSEHDTNDPSSMSAATKRRTSINIRPVPESARMGGAERTVLSKTGPRKPHIRDLWKTEKTAAPWKPRARPTQSNETQLAPSDSQYRLSAPLVLTNHTIEPISGRMIHRSGTASRQ